LSQLSEPFLVEPAEMPPPCRPGPKLGAVDYRVVGTHRTWLLALRERYRDGAHTIGELSEVSCYARSRISELLRGSGGRYPRWEITQAVATAMRMPVAPLRRLWREGALEAGKKPDWVKRNKGAEEDPEATLPLPLQGLRRLHGDTYLSYAEIFLPLEAAAAVVERTFHILWARQHAVFSSEHAARPAWVAMREQVRERADEQVALHLAALRTMSVQAADGFQDAWYSLAGQMDLFLAMKDLAAYHTDVLLLRHVLVRSVEETAHVLGTHKGLAAVWERQALQHLEAIPELKTFIGGMTR
jgi:hypothetical protein